MDYIIFIVSLAVLIIGADFIIRESERIALHFDIPAFIIGATLIAVGTSLPEMAASVTASYHDKSELAVSNVLGSVTFNITLVLGILFLLGKQIHPKRDLFAKDSAWALFPVLMFILVSFDGQVDRFEGVVFLLLMLGYVLFLVNDAKELLEVDEELRREKFQWLKSIALLIAGFVLVVGGADYTVSSATIIAKNWGVSEWFIGLFLISLGTSLPELVVSIMAVKKGQADMAIGNIIGSNVANFTMVLGSAAAVSPLRIDLQAYSFDIAIAVSASLMLMFITANKLYNKSGAIALLLVLSLFIHNAVSTL
jgi:cation:H+ antiporter